MGHWLILQKNGPLTTEIAVLNLILLVKWKMADTMICPSLSLLSAQKVHNDCYTIISRNHCLVHGKSPDITPLLSQYKHEKCPLSYSKLKPK